MFGFGKRKPSPPARAAAASSDLSQIFPNVFLSFFHFLSGQQAERLPYNY
jgi:hypothetical protein